MWTARDVFLLGYCGYDAQYFRVAVTLLPSHAAADLLATLPARERRTP